MVFCADEFYSLSMKIIKNSTIHAALYDAGVSLPNIAYLDSKYVCPTEDWLKSAARTLSMQIKDVVGAYQVESNDCDNFALAMMSIMRMFNAKRLSGAEFAVGYCSYTREDGVYHAINFALVEDNKLVFIEPQSGELVNLTGKEIRSCGRFIV